MKMKKLLLFTVLATALAALSSPAAYAQAPEGGSPPPNEGVCDELIGATPGLYGLCVAFCEAQDCEADFALEDPFENCSPSNPKVLARYDAKRTSADPPMPCIQNSPCPCWNTAELDALRYPDPTNDDEQTLCFTSDIRLSQFWKISSPRYHTAPYVNGSTVTNRFICGLIDIDNQQANSPPNRIRLLEIDEAQYAACAGEMIASGQDRGFTCWDP